MIEEITYPHFGPIAGLYPNPGILLGHDIYWTLKEDGSNIGCYLDADDNLQIRSRNQKVASPLFFKIFESTGYIAGITEALLHARDYGNEYMIFGELMTKGKSPTRIEYHTENKYTIFDIFSMKINEPEVGGFLPYSRVHQEAHHMNVPVVELMRLSNVNNLESLYSIRDELLAECEERKKEGVVGKVYKKIGVDDYCFVKEKLDSVKFDKVKTDDEPYKVVLPDLPSSEIYGAIEKARADLGDEFRMIQKAMPLIAKYVGEECRKHHCGNVKNLIGYYKQRLEDLR